MIECAMTWLLSNQHNLNQLFRHLICLVYDDVPTSLAERILMLKDLNASEVGNLKCLGVQHAFILMEVLF